MIDKRSEMWKEAVIEAVDLIADVLLGMMAYAHPDELEGIQVSLKKVREVRSRMGRSHIVQPKYDPAKDGLRPPADAPKEGGAT